MSIYSNSITKPVEKLIANSGLTDLVVGISNVSKAVYITVEQAEQAEPLKAAIEQGPWSVRFREFKGQTQIICDRLRIR